MGGSFDKYEKGNLTVREQNKEVEIYEAEYVSVDGNSSSVGLKISIIVCLLITLAFIYTSMVPWRFFVVFGLLSAYSYLLIKYKKQ
jgi:hypothetical protein